VIPIILKPLELFQLLTGRTEIIRKIRIHLSILARDIGSRSFAEYDRLQLARRYICNSFSAMGAAPIEERFTVNGLEAANIIVEIPGSSKKYENEIILVGAHYDTVEGSAGANDNASGIAALLELYRILAPKKHRRTIRLVAFTLEEPPFFNTEEMGSFIHARRAAKRKDRIRMMVNLDMIGYAGTFVRQNFPLDDMKSQYPVRGNYLVVGSLPSFTAQAYLCRNIFNRHSRRPAHAVIQPASYSGIASSDHLSFIRNEYPAVLFTDTGFYRNANYHTEYDRYETINLKFLAENIYSLSRTIAYLANRSRIP
jgi:Zn-dependent M28 family amino/carboxypeptidase